MGLQSHTPLSPPTTTCSCHRGSWGLLVVSIRCWLTRLFLSCFPGSYECGICGKKYKYYNCFQTHVRAHRGEWRTGAELRDPYLPICCLFFFHADPSRMTSEHFLQWKWDPRQRGAASLTWGSTLGWGWSGAECPGRATELLLAVLWTAARGPHPPTGLRCRSVSAALAGRYSCHLV